MADPDLELLEHWRGGDEAAGRDLFERHFNSIYRFFRAKIGEAAEDLTQQTFMAAVKGRERFEGRASFRTYLFSIARFRLYNHVRDRGRRAKIEDPDGVGERSIIDHGLDSPSAVIAAAEESRLLLRALRHLPLDLQIALELHYWEDLRVAEIAEVLDKPEGTIKRRLQRARAKLEETIRAMAEDPALADSTIGDIAGWAARLRGKLGR